MPEPIRRAVRAWDLVQRIAAEREIEGTERRVRDGP